MPRPSHREKFAKLMATADAVEQLVDDNSPMADAYQAVIRHLREQARDAAVDALTVRRRTKTPRAERDSDTCQRKVPS